MTTRRRHCAGVREPQPQLPLLQMLLRAVPRLGWRTTCIALLRAAGQHGAGCGGDGCRQGRRPERCNCGLLRTARPAERAPAQAAAAGSTWLQILHSEQPGQPITRAATQRAPLPWSAGQLLAATTSVAALAALLLITYPGA